MLTALSLHLSTVSSQQIFYSLKQATHDMGLTVLLVCRLIPASLCVPWQGWRTPSAIMIFCPVENNGLSLFSDTSAEFLGFDIVANAMQTAVPYAVSIQDERTEVQWRLLSHSFSLYSISWPPWHIPSLHHTISSRNLLMRHIHNYTRSIPHHMYLYILLSS